MNSLHCTHRIFRRPAACAAFAGLCVLAASAGCAGGRQALDGGAGEGQLTLTAYQEEAEPALEVKPERIDPLDPPEWFSGPPQKKEDAWFVAGTAVSGSAAEAVRAAEEDALAAASLLAAEEARSAWDRILLARAVAGDAPDEATVQRLAPAPESELIIGAVPERSIVRCGSRRGDDGLVENYHQGYALLRVPADNFVFSPERCLEKTRARLLVRDLDGAIHVLRGAALCWPGHTEILAALADLQEKTGRLDQAIDTAKQLRSVSPSDSLNAVDSWISALEEEHSGSEFAYLMKRMLNVQKDAERKGRLRIEPQQRTFRTGSTAAFNVLADRPWEYCGVWLGSASIRFVPVAERTAVAALTVDTAPQLGPHLFLLLASSDRPDWYAERTYSETDSGSPARGPAARQPTWSLDSILDDLEKRAASGSLITAAYAVEIVP